MKHLSYCGHPVSASDLDCPCVAISNLGKGGGKDRGGTVAVRSVGRTHAGHLGGDNKKVMTPPPQPIDQNFCFSFSPRAETVENWGGGGLALTKGGKNASN